MNFLKHRLSEASSWAGIAAAFGTLASQIPPNWSASCYGAAAGATILAVLLRDPGAPDKPQ